MIHGAGKPGVGGAIHCFIPCGDECWQSDILTLYITPASSTQKRNPEVIDTIIGKNSFCPV